MKNPFEKPKTERDSDKVKTPRRLLLALEAQKLAVKELNLYGQEHLAEIPKDKKVIIAVTHLSDLDLPLAAAALAKYFNLAIVNMSVHHSFTAEPASNLGLRIAGSENFIPLDYQKTKNGKQASFNPDNFEPMAKALAQNKTILMAAHNPAHDWQLPAGGYGAAYLSSLADDETIILPVTVNLESDQPVGMYESPLKTLTKKPVANVYLNPPLELKKIPGLEDLAKIIRKREAGQNLTSTERTRFSELRKSLQAQSDQIMTSLADSLPPEKRGRYK